MNYFRMKAAPIFTLLLVLTVSAIFPGPVFGTFRIVIMQDQRGTAEKYRPLLTFLKERGVDATFVAAKTYPHAAELFASGLADGMFSGSGIAGCLIIKQLAYPVVRPVSVAGWSTYWAVVIGPKGSKSFTRNAGYFDNKRVIFCSLASAGEFYFQSLDGSAQSHATLLRASTHSAALDALSRKVADFAIIKNRVWDKASPNYPDLMLLGEDRYENPDGTFVVSENTDKAAVDDIRKALLELNRDQSVHALSVKKELKISGFVMTTIDDFKYTISLLKKAGVDREFNFTFAK